VSQAIFILPLRRPAARAAAAMDAGSWLVICAALFNLLLCFLNSRHWIAAGTTDIIVTELAILAAGLLCIRHHINKGIAQSVLLILVYLAGLKLINPGVDLKILHDIAIMYVFYKLGTLSSIERANRTLWIIMLIVLAFGAFEWLAPDLFGQVFDVWSYYVNKGVIDQDTVNYAGTNLFISGNRGSTALRNFFPGIFGAHRISSIFLEPDSLGNFAVIVFAWCLSTKPGTARTGIWLMVLAGLCVVLADSRFAGICCAVMLACRQTTAMRSGVFVFAAPVAVVIGLTIAGSLSPMPVNVPPFIMNDDFAGRLLFSGRLLDDWGAAQWFGFAASPVYTADTGYAYFINNLGLPLAFIMLLLFALSRPRSEEAAWMKAMMSVYFAASLCVGASVFTIKTAAIIWFLYGAANAARAALAEPAAA
jgi:putative polymerase